MKTIDNEYFVKTDNINTPSELKRKQIHTFSERNLLNLSYSENKSKSISKSVKQGMFENVYNTTFNTMLHSYVNSPQLRESLPSPHNKVQSGLKNYTVHPDDDPLDLRIMLNLSNNSENKNISVSFDDPYQNVKFKTNDKFGKDAKNESKLKEL